MKQINARVSDDTAAGVKAARKVMGMSLTAFTRWGLALAILEARRVSDAMRERPSA